MKKAVVTGGAGFIGSHIVDALLGKGFEVHIIDDLSGNNTTNVNPKAVFHQKSIVHLEDIKPIFKDAEYIFHLAAQPRVQYSLEHPQETHEINVTGTLNVLVAATEANVKKVVFSASSAAYGEPEKLPTSEDAPINPKSPYGLHKYMGELYLKLWNEVYGLPTISLRYFNVYGDRFNPEGAYALVIGRFLKLRKEGKSITITGDGNQTRDFIHVSDVVRANILAAESSIGNGDVFNIGSGKNASINKIAELIGGPIEYIPARLEPKNTLANVEKAKRILNWEPTVSLEEGITQLKNSYLNK